MALVDRYYQGLRDKLARETEEAARQAEVQRALYEEIFGAIADVTTEITDEANRQRLDDLDAAQKKELAMVEGNEAAKASVEKKYNDLRAEEAARYARQKMINERILAGEKLALDAELDAKQLEDQKKAAELDLAEAQKKGDKQAEEAAVSKLAALQKQLDDKNDVIMNSAIILKEGMTDIFANMFAGNTDGMKESMREMFATLVGFLKKLLISWVMEIVLTSSTLKALAAMAGPAAPLVVAASSALIYTGMNALLNPILNALLSFPTGAMFDQPTVALIGDGSRLGGENREWLLRNDQLIQVLNWVLSKYEARLNAGFARLEAAILSTRVVGTLKGSDILLASERASADESRRQRT